jgi:uncharacterized protein YbgA (DUF1722 family)/uncharacterized protein YbbK (DUF523 family)
MVDSNVLPLRIGVSACLAGAAVRFDGGHRRDRFVLEDLGGFAELVQACPEVGIGPGTPRETLRLERGEAGTRVVAPRSGADHTEALRRWSEARIEALRALRLSGYVLKKGSPSCGMERVRVYGAAARDGVGVFASVLREGLPLLPIEEEGRLNDPGLRDHFLVRVFAFHRLQCLLASGLAPRDLGDFQAREKLLLMAHDPAAVSALGRIAAEAAARPPEETARRYATAFAGILACGTTRARHVNALQHLAGYFKRALDAPDRREIGEAIAAYGAREAPRAVPVALLRHHARRHDVTYITRQTYLEPYPAVLRPAEAA